MTLAWASQTIPNNSETFMGGAVDPVHGIVLINGVGSHVYRSTNGGTSWTDTTPAGSQLASVTNASGVMFGGGQFLLPSPGNSQIYRSTDGSSGSWTSATTPPSGFTGNNNFPIQLAFSPTLGTGQGMWMAVQKTSTPTTVFSTSTDGGNTWTAASTISGIQGILTNVLWDGTAFAFAARDTGNTISNIVSSTNGTSWSLTNAGSIFTTTLFQLAWDGKNTRYAATEISGSGNHPSYRSATSLAALASAGDQDLTSVLAGSSVIFIYADSFLQVAVESPTTSNTNAIAERTKNNPTWLADSTPVSCLLLGVVWDNVHFTLIATGSGGSNGVILSAPYLGPNPIITVSPHTATVPFGGSIQLTGTTANPPANGIIWTVNGIVNGNGTVGDVTGTKVGAIIDGFYLAPQVPLGQTTVTVTAARLDIPTITDSCVITLNGRVAPPSTTPPQNVTAPGGIGGSLWGANGGGITPTGTKPVAATLSDAERRNNYQPVPPTVAPTPFSLGEQISDSALDRQTPDSALGFGGGNQG